MATLEQLQEGIRRAHAAGRTEDVRTLGTAYRAMQQQQPSGPPAGAKPGSREYADWAAAEARAGRKLPQVSEAPPEWKDPLSSDLGAKAQAMSSAWLNDIPVAGPAILDMAQKAKAAIHGVPLETVQYDTQRAMDANPVESKVAGVTSSIANLLPAGMTAIGGRLLGTVGSLPARVMAGGASAAAISGADTLARGGSSDEALTNLGIGAAVGGAIPVVGAGVRRLLTPLPANAAKTRAAEVLRQEGVDLTAGQRTGSKGMQYAESELGGGAAENFMERQADQFTSAALRRVGVQASRVTPDVIDTAYRNIGQQFDDLAARNGMQTDARFVQDMQRAWREFEGVTNPSSRPPFVERLLQDVAGRMRTGYAFLPGDWFKSTRSELARLARGSSNPEFASALREIMGALDDAMERTLQQTNPADLGAWREARRTYANMLVIEDAATRAGEKAADGIITPQALRSAAAKQNKRAFARGRNEFADLANAGVSTMSPLPQSGTAPRAAVNAIKATLPFVGAAVGGAGTMGAGAVAGAAAGLAAPWAVGRGILSAPGRAYLGNQMANGLPLFPLAPAVPALELTRR